MPLQGLGRLLMLAGGLMFAFGLVLQVAGRVGLGRLPGDVYVHRGSFTFYFPWVTSLVLSLGLSLLLYLASLVLRR